MPRVTRSCKDLSKGLNIQTAIDFPKRKSRNSNESTKVRTRMKRKSTICDENSDSPVKSPVKKCLTNEAKVRKIEIRSPLIDRTNSLKHATTLLSARRKILLSDTSQKEHAYSKVRGILHTAIPNQLISREKELGTIEKFIKSTVVGSNPGSLYMSGAPGTGKTASLMKVLDNIDLEQKKFRYVFLNCMTLKISQSIFVKLANEVSCTNKYTSKDSLKFLEKIFTSSGKKILLVLDEIDQLESKNQEVLYRLFEMPFLPNSRLILIGIANALDLTDRILPRLQSKGSCLPALLQFAPYSKSEIAEIIQDRIKQTDADIIDSSAIQFCARKVSAMSGDARKALDILRRSIEMVEMEDRRSVIAAPPKKVTVVHVSAVCNEVYGSRLSSNTNNACGFPLQQKVIVCSLMVSMKEKKTKELSLAKLYEIYCKVCKSRQVSCLNEEEYNCACVLLETQGIIDIKKTKDGRTQISFRLQESEIEHALQDKTLMSSILDGDIPKFK